MNKVLTLAYVALILAGSAAFAQTPAGSSNPDTTTSDKQMSIENPALMAPFYTDNTMSVLRADAELKAAWEAMNADQQATMKKECETSNSEKAKEFCGKLQMM